MFDKLRLTNIFNLLAIILVIAFFGFYNIFEETKKVIIDTNQKSHLDYIDNVTSNIGNAIKQTTDNNIYENLKKDKALRKNLEYLLYFFITDRYRYIYVLNKEENGSNEFQFLLDGTEDIDEKSEFEERFTPLDINKWNNAYKNQKSLYFKQEGNLDEIWMTYLKPVVVNGKTEALIVVDFSLKEHNQIIVSLQKFESFFEIAITLTLIILFFILLVSFIDAKRAKVNEKLYEELKMKTQEISEFNLTLAQKVDDEVEKNREKDKQMFQQNRLAQMGEMIGMIAHQWRQPLAAISSTSSAINLKAKLNKLDNVKVIELTNKINEYSKHLSETIDDFRKFFKDEKEQSETTYNEILKNVLSIIEISIRNNMIEIVEDYNCDDKFLTYPNEIMQVLLNLIKNAEDILIEKKVENPYIKISTYVKEDNLILEIEDNGGGVPEDIIDKVFIPYFSTKLKKDGTGLGLYMSKTIIEDHCLGSLSVCNRNDGALFTISLPKTEDSLSI